MKRLGNRGSESVESESQLPSVSGATAVNVLAEVGGYTPNALIDTSDKGEQRGTFRYLRFFSKKAENAVDVVQALGKGIQEGHPYISGPDGIFDAAGLSFAILEGEFPYWVTSSKTKPYAPDRAWLKKAHKVGSIVGDDGQKVQEAYLGIGLFLPGRDSLPEPLAPGVTVLIDVRGTKAPFVADYLRGVEESMSLEFARANGTLTSNVPPRFRQLAEFRVIAKPGGYNGYALAKASYTPASVRQIECIQAWGADPEAQDDREALSRLMERKIEEVKALAATTSD